MYKEQSANESEYNYTEIDIIVVDVEDCTEASSFHFSRSILIVRDVCLLGRLGSSTLCLEDNVETGSCRVDGTVLADTSTVRVDLLCFVVWPVVHLYVVERTTTYTHSACMAPASANNSRRNYKHQLQS